MIQWPEDIKIYLHREPVDFRKAINGLSVIVQDEMALSPFDRALFVFCNKKRSQLKVLYWDETGFVLWQKRRSEEHTSELQSRGHLVCRLLLETENMYGATAAIVCRRIQTSTARPVPID